VDLSQPLREHLPRKGSGGLLASLGLIVAAFLVAVVAGLATVLVLRLVAPQAPTWLGLVGGLAVFLPTLRAMARRFAWIVPWYYLLPALVFLLTFTLFPVILTVVLAFTDYSGVRNGQLNVASETAIVAMTETRDALTIADPRVFDCQDLRNGCRGARALVYGSGTIETVAVALDGMRLTLSEELPAGAEPRTVSLHLPDLGFAIDVDVRDVDGATLILDRAPPFPPDLEQLVVELVRPTFAVRMSGDDGRRIALGEPLPEGFEAVSIVRYNDFGYLGVANFRTILAQVDRALGPVFAWNVGFAFVTVGINLLVGLLLGVLLNNPDLRLRGLYRTLLILPWALPNIITIQVWRGFLNENFGVVNRLLMLFDVTEQPISWLLGNAWSARAAVLLVNLWLGYPFMMVAVLGALTAIPRELYEAARIDGATAWQGFLRVTAPLLRSAMLPITLTGFAFNFNNFNIIFLLTDGGPAVDWGTATARGTDILISWAYNEAFRSQGGYAYGLGSAISLLIFVITVAVSLVNFRVTGALKEEPA